MLLAFKIIVAILGVIAITTGGNDFWKGAAVKGDFGKDLGETVNHPTLNFTIRFLGAIWMGFGALLILFITDIDQYYYPLLMSFGFVILGGIGRVVSIRQHGTEDGFKTTAYSILAVELILVPILTVWLLLM